MDSLTTWVARHAKVSGVIDTSGDVHVEGRVEGSIRTTATVTIAASGVAMAEIHAGSADVRGVVIGNIIAAERIDVTHGARVVGDLRAPLVELDPGAVIEGSIDRRLPGVEEPEGGSRTTTRLRGTPLRRPSRPITALPEADEPSHEAAVTPRADAPHRAAPHAPRPAERARLIPKPSRGNDKP